MRIYKLIEVSSKPRRNNTHSTDWRIYNNDLYMEAEVNVESNLEEDISDEEFDRLVEKEFQNIMTTLEVYGRYPVVGIPSYVAY